MKRIFLFLLLLLSQGLGNFVYSIDFRIVDGIDTSDLKTKMEKNAKLLLESINGSAAHGDSILNLSTSYASTDAIREIESLWKCLHFRTIDNVDTVYCSRKKVNNQERYEARHIHIEIIPLDDKYVGDKNREIRIDFDMAGIITSLAITLPWQSIETIKRHGSVLGPKEYERRCQIIKFCEDLKKYYQNKDINNLRKVYSKYAIVVTGQEIKTIEKFSTKNMKSRRNKNKKKYKFVTSTGKEYLDKLEALFLRCKTIEVGFDKYQIMKYDPYSNYYVVTFEQDWHTIYNNDHSYDDFGYVCLLWDFSETSPIITFRSWQPEDTPETDKISRINIEEFTTIKH